MNSGWARKLANGNAPTALIADATISSRSPRKGRCSSLAQRRPPTRTIGFWPPAGHGYAGAAGNFTLTRTYAVT